MLQLTKRCLEGEQPAWDELWLVYHECAATHVCRLMRGAGFDACDADGTVIDSFGSLYEDDCQRLRSFHGSTQAELRDWLLRFAINATRDRIDSARRKDRRERTAMESHSQHDAGGPTEAEMRSLFTDLERTFSADEMHLIRSLVGWEADPLGPSPSSATSERTRRRRIHDLFVRVRKFLGFHDRRKPNDSSE